MQRKDRLSRGWLFCAAVAAALASTVFMGDFLLPSAHADSSKKTIRKWKAKCASCHGEDGKGQTEQGKKIGISDMTTAEWQKARTDEQMKKSVVEGLKREENGKKQEMEPFKDKLKPDEIDALIAYIRTFKKDSP